jgi:glutathionylspermidine synthase
MYGTPDARWITQQRAKLAAADGWNAVIGSWIVGETAAGIIFREARQSIIQDSSRVVPHYFR